jgi:rod shape-determining protein MreD
MKNVILALVFLLLFLLEGTVFAWLIPYQVDRLITVVPHPVLIFTIFIAVYLHRYKALLYGFSFGLLKDVVFYGHVIGIYTFSTAFIGYVIGLICRHFHPGFVLAISMVAIGNFFYELIVYGLYRLLNLVHVELEWALFHQFLPTMLFNTVLAVLLFAPIHRWVLQPFHDADEKINTP